jgi:hypothetical protein
MVKLGVEPRIKVVLLYMERVKSAGDICLAYEVVPKENVGRF